MAGLIAHETSPVCSGTVLMCNGQARPSRLSAHRCSGPSGGARSCVARPATRRAHSRSACHFGGRKVLPRNLRAHIHCPSPAPSRRRDPLGESCKRRDPTHGPTFEVGLDRGSLDPALRAIRFDCCGDNHWLPPLADHSRAPALPLSQQLGDADDVLNADEDRHQRSSVFIAQASSTAVPLSVGIILTPMGLKICRRAPAGLLMGRALGMRSMSSQPELARLCPTRLHTAVIHRQRVLTTDPADGNLVCRDLPAIRRGRSRSSHSALM